MANLHAHDAHDVPAGPAPEPAAAPLHVDLARLRWALALIGASHGRLHPRLRLRSSSRPRSRPWPLAASPVKAGSVARSRSSPPPCTFFVTAMWPEAKELTEIPGESPHPAQRGCSACRSLGGVCHACSCRARRRACCSAVTLDRDVRRRLRARRCKLLSRPDGARLPLQPGLLLEWLPELGVHYHVAVDGISLVAHACSRCSSMPIATFVSFGSHATRASRNLCFALLLLQGAMIGVVRRARSLPVLPVVLGADARADVPDDRHLGRRRRASSATVKFFLYTMFGSDADARRHACTSGTGPTASITGANRRFDLLAISSA